jgi:hypothetical protein
MKNKNILYGLLGVVAIAGLYFWNKKSGSVSDAYTESELNQKIEKVAKEQYAKIKNKDGAKTEPQIIDGLKMLIERIKVNGFTSKKDIDNFFNLIIRMEDKSLNNPLTIEESLFLDKMIQVKK